MTNCTMIVVTNTVCMIMRISRVMRVCQAELLQGLVKINENHLISVDCYVLVRAVCLHFCHPTCYYWSIQSILHVAVKLIGERRQSLIKQNCFEIIYEVVLSRMYDSLERTRQLLKFLWEGDDKYSHVLITFCHYVVSVFLISFGFLWTIIINYIFTKLKNFDLILPYRGKS